MSREGEAWAFVGPGALLHLIRDEGADSRADLCRRTGLSRPAVDERLDPLVERGLVREWTTRNWTARRPPSTLAFNPESGVVAAADLGGRWPRVALADLSGRIVAEDPVALEPPAEAARVLSLVQARLDDLLRTAGREPSDLRGIVAGVPTAPADTRWEGFSVAGWLGERTGAPVLVEDDVSLMALGERSEQWAECDPFMLVGAGAGFSLGLISSGHLLRGPQGTAGGIGHVRVAGHDTVGCVCGNTGCLDAVAGGRALAAKLGGRRAEDVVAHVRSGDADAIRLVRDAGRSLGQVLAGCVNLLNPDALVIGGALAEAHEPLLAGVREVVFQESLPLATRSLRIAPSRLGERACVIGGIELVLGHVLAPAAIDRWLAPASRGLPAVL
jgi:predicted NBD/HSP70 family sugar kinase